MGPLSVVNWHAIHRRFCALMWLLVAALLAAIVVHFSADSPACSATAARFSTPCSCDAPADRGGAGQCPASARLGR